MMSKFPSNLLPKFGLISWKILEILKTHIANVLTEFWVHFSDVPTSTDKYSHYSFYQTKMWQLMSLDLRIHVLKEKWITKQIWFSERNSALPWCTKCKTKALFSPIIPLYCIATVWIEQLKCGQKLLAIQQLFSENLCLKPCTNKIKIETIAWMISYSKCSICCCLSKLSSNFGWLFTFCYCDRATSIQIA